MLRSLILVLIINLFYPDNCGIVEEMAYTYNPNKEEFAKEGY